MLWIVAGPNGCGKSTFYNRTDIEGWGGTVWIINPDLLTAKIVEEEALALNDANLAAVQRIETWLNASIETYQTIGVETVLSSPKYRPLVESARAHGFDVRMIYVVLDSAELQIARVSRRVREGGHDVPADKIIARRRRSFEELAWFAKNVDHLMIFNNSTGDPELIGGLKNDYLIQVRPFPPDMLEVLNSAGLETPSLNNPNTWHLL